LLYDQPCEDSKRVRVAGPFTVESLSPHRALSTDDDRPATESEACREAATGQFETMILENLKKAGVQNTIKNERLTFDRLEPYPGTWLHAAGEYTEKGGDEKAGLECGDSSPPSLAATRRGVGVSTFLSVQTRTSALTPLGERVTRRGVFISRDEAGEGVQTQRADPNASISNTKRRTFCTNKSGA
jgi:hypothetical protein